MSAKVTAWALEQKIPHHLFRVLIQLADAADAERWECWPSVRFLCERTGMPERTVQRHLRELVDCGLLWVECRYGDKGRQTSNIYRLNPERSDGGTCAARGATLAPSPGATDDTPPVPPVAPSPVTRVAPLEPKEEGTKKKNLASLQTHAREAWPADAWERFAAAYPHKVAIEAARAEFRKVERCGVKFADLMEGVRGYAEHNPPDVQWKYAAGWLRDRRWLDDWSTVKPRGNCLGAALNALHQRLSEPEERGLVIEHEASMVQARTSSSGVSLTPPRVSPRRPLMESDSDRSARADAVRRKMGRKRL